MILSFFITILAVVLGFRFTFFMLRVCGRLLAVFLSGAFYLVIGVLAATLLGLGSIALIIVLATGIAAIIRGLSQA